MSSRITEFVMTQIYSDTKAIFRNNVELLKTVLQCWKDRIDTPHKFVNLMLIGQNCVCLLIGYDSAILLIKS